MSRFLIGSHYSSIDAVPFKGVRDRPTLMVKCGTASVCELSTIGGGTRSVVDQQQ